MALFEEQITDTLETGAPPIKYEGDEGPQDPRQEAMLAQLKEEYMQYVFEMKELDEPVMSFEEWYQSIYKASQMGVQAPEEEMMSEEMMIREPAAYGGIMDTDSGRRMYGLGSFFKKITKPFKKVGSKLVGGAKKLFKSPVGKIGLAALLAGAPVGGGAWFGSGSGFGAAKSGLGSLMGKFPGATTAIKEGAKGLFKNKAGTGWSFPKLGIAAASALPLLGIGTTAKVDEIEGFNQDGEFDIDFSEMRREAAGVDMNNPSELAAFYEKYGVTPGSLSLGSAEGGRIGFALGSKADFAIEDVMTGGVEDEIGGITGIMRQADLQRKGNVGQFYAAKGGSPNEGGIMDLGGMEKDYRETGGFVDLGAEEKADDVPARLSVNEFVMTADAVRGAGDGDIDLGAKRMEDVMKTLEQKGKKENMKMAGPDWYIKRIEHLMFLGYDYDEAADIAYDSDKYYEIVGDPGEARKKGASDMFEVSERLSEVV